MCEHAWHVLVWMASAKAGMACASVSVSGRAPAVRPASAVLGGAAEANVIDPGSGVCLRAVQDGTVLEGVSTGDLAQAGA